MSAKFPRGGGAGPFLARSLIGLKLIGESALGRDVQINGVIGEYV